MTNIRSVLLKNINTLSNIIDGKEDIRNLKGVQKHCNDRNRRLGLSEYIETFKSTFKNFLGDVKQTIDTTRNLDGKLTDAENSVTEVKNSLGLNLLLSDK